MAIANSAKVPPWTLESSPVKVVTSFLTVSCCSSPRAHLHRLSVAVKGPITSKFATSMNSAFD